MAIPRRPVRGITMFLSILVSFSLLCSFDVRETEADDWTVVERYAYVESVEMQIFVTFSGGKTKVS